MTQEAERVGRETKRLLDELCDLDAGSVEHEDFLARGFCAWAADRTVFPPAKRLYLRAEALYRQRDK